MYGIAMLYLSWKDHPTTEVEIEHLHHDYARSTSSQRLFCIGINFEDPLDDDIPLRRSRCRETLMKSPMKRRGNRKTSAHSMSR